MPIKQTTPDSVIDNYLKRCHELAMDLTYKAMAKLGELCINRIRDRSSDDSWKDHTGNLRSSIGYMITRDGKPIVKGGFQPTSAPEGNGGKGRQNGENYVDSLTSQYASYQLAMVVVAGMEYAIYVEAHDNKDVLASTEIWARNKWKSEEPKLKAAIEAAWDRLAKQMKIA